MQKDKQWGSVLLDWERSGLSQAEYCRQKGILDTRLSYWKNKLSQSVSSSSKPEPKFISINPEIKAGKIEIAFGAVKIILPEGMESKKVAELIKCLN